MESHKDEAVEAKKQDHDDKVRRIDQKALDRAGRIARLIDPEIGERPGAEWPKAIEGVEVVIDATPHQLRTDFPPPGALAGFAAATRALVAHELPETVKASFPRLKIIIPLHEGDTADHLREARDNAIELASRAFEEG